MNRGTRRIPSKNRRRPSYFKFVALACVGAAIFWLGYAYRGMACRINNQEPPRSLPVARKTQAPDGPHLSLQEKNRLIWAPYLTPNDTVLVILDLYEPQTKTLSRITIETHPLGALPLSTDYFLNQVARGTYVGASFFRNERHVVQASQPLGGGHSISRQEYDPKYPHEKYTCGLAGQPGGTDFYVSMATNTRAHGPGGQGSPGVADVTFGRLWSRGDVETMKRIQAYPYTKVGGMRHLVDKVVIQRAYAATRADAEEKARSRPRTKRD